MTLKVYHYLLHLNFFESQNTLFDLCLQDTLVGQSKTVNPCFFSFCWIGSWLQFLGGTVDIGPFAEKLPVLSWRDKACLRLYSSKRARGYRAPVLACLACFSIAWVLEEQVVWTQNAWCTFWLKVANAAPLSCTLLFLESWRQSNSCVTYLMLPRGLDNFPIVCDTCFRVLCRAVLPRQVALSAQDSGSRLHICKVSLDYSFKYSFCSIVHFSFCRDSSFMYITPPVFHFTFLNPFTSLSHFHFFWWFSCLSSVLLDYIFIWVCSSLLTL